MSKKEVEKEARFVAYAPKAKMGLTGISLRSTTYDFEIDGIQQEITSGLIEQLGDGVLVTVDGGKGKAKFSIEGTLTGCIPKVKTDAKGDIFKSTKVEVYERSIDIANSAKALRLLGDMITLTVVPHQIKMPIEGE